MSKWQKVPGAEEYEVSEDGHLRCWLRQNRRGPRLNEPRYILGAVKDNGYIVVSLRSKLTTMHQIVALAFLGPCPPGHEVSHKDGNKRNNRLDNLEYLTHSGNVSCDVSSGRFYRSKLNEFQLKEILTSHESGAELARRYGVTRATVNKVRRGVTYKHAKTQLQLT